jgi:hypothetical protein
MDFEKLEPKYPKGWSNDSDRDCNRYIVELERLVRYKLTPRFGAAVVFRLGIEITAHRRPWGFAWVNSIAPKSDFLFCTVNKGSLASATPTQTNPLY